MDLLVDLEHYELSMDCEVSGVRWRFYGCDCTNLLIPTATCTMDLLIDLEHYELSMDCEVSGVRWRFMAVILPIYILRWTFCRRSYNGVHIGSMNLLYILKYLVYADGLMAFVVLNLRTNTWSDIDLL